MTTRHETGMKTRRKVLGEDHVNAVEKNKTEFDAPFQELITEAAWGQVWSRPQLTLRERSLITLALLAAQGMDDEVAMHARATANTGATAEDMREVLMHVAIYAGVPRANHAFKIIKQVLAERIKS
jgi:4-carboxymuconolactone decarboxylase